MYRNEEIKVPRFEESAGFYTTQELSQHMSKIKSLNSKPEVKIAKTLWSLGLRYRKNVKAFPGKPDIVFRKFMLIIFIDGDFWHGYNWNIKKNKLKSNRAYWIPKIERNIQRDMEQVIKLENMGFKVLRFWEHDVNKNFEICIRKIIEELRESGAKI